MFEQTFLQKQGNARSTRTIELKGPRGVIQDRNGEPLAVSTMVKAIWIDPKRFAATREQLEQLLDILNISRDSFFKKIKF